MLKLRVAAAVSAGILGLSAIATVASAQIDQIDPESGPAGTPIKVDGRNCARIVVPVPENAELLQEVLGIITPFQLEREVELTVLDAETAAEFGRNVIPNEELGEDGTWSGFVTVSEDAPAGSYSVRASCVTDGVPVVLDARAFTVEEDPTPGPTTTSTTTIPPTPTTTPPGVITPPSEDDEEDEEESEDEAPEDETPAPAPAPPAPTVNGEPTFTG